MSKNKDIESFIVNTRNRQKCIKQINENIKKSENLKKDELLKRLDNNFKINDSLVKGKHVNFKYDGNILLQFMINYLNNIVYDKNLNQSNHTTKKDYATPVRYPKKKRKRSFKISNLQKNDYLRKRKRSFKINCQNNDYLKKRKLYFLRSKNVLIAK
jgi:hypothetical protein